MSNEQHNSEHAQDAFIDALFEHTPVNIAALLRACADGELNPDQCERLMQLLESQPQAMSQHEFELKLRECCNRTMTKSPPCPESLRERVGAIAAAAREDEPAYAKGVESSAAYTKDRSFWTRSPLLSIAAVLMLSVAGVLIWQSANLSGAFRSALPLNLEQASYSERIGEFALGEHTRCCDDDAAEAKLVERDIEQAVAYFSERFDRSVQMPDMAMSDEQVDFFGGGDCHVPKTEKSGHLRFDAYDDAGNPIALSLFIAPDPGLLPLEDGTTYRLSSEACEIAGVRVFVWISEGVQYLLVSEASDKTCATVRALMNAPQNLSQI